MIKKLYPKGKEKAFVVTYDDGVLQDKRFVELLDKYGIKGTFNLNSGLMKIGFQWTHESGLAVKRLCEDTVKNLYKNHEVASHTLTHPYMNCLSEAEIMRELTEDKANLEKLFRRMVKGFAVPFDYFSPLIKECVKKAGFDYCRISEESGSFAPPADVFALRPGIFHTSTKIKDFVRNFINTDEELATCIIAGHSYDLDTENLWEDLEEIFALVSKQNNIWFATTAELVAYLKEETI